MHECVVYDDLEACEMFLNAGSDVDAQDIHGWTALHFAAAFNLNDMTQLLLDRGADTAKLTSEGYDSMIERIISRAMFIRFCEYGISCFFQIFVMKSFHVHLL